MRIRTIKPELWVHPVMARLSDSTKLLAIGLLNYADDQGYFFADASLIRSALRPFDDDSKIILGSIQELSRVGYLEVRESSSHGLIGRIVNFDRHQRVDKPKESSIKQLFDSSNVLGSIQDSSALYGKGREGKGTGKGINLPPAQPAEVRGRNLLFDALARSTDGEADQLTDSTRRSVGVALAQIRKVSPNVTEIEIERRASNYRAHFRDAAITAMALAKHWGRCDKPPEPKTVPWQRPATTPEEHAKGF